MSKEEQFSVLLVLCALLCFGTGIALFGIESVRYAPISFADCRTVPDVIRRFFAAYRKTLPVFFLVTFGGFTRFCRLFSFFGVGYRSLLSGAAAGYLYQTGGRRYYLFLAMTVGVTFLLIQVGRLAYCCAYTADGFPKRLCDLHGDFLCLKRTLIMYGFLCLTVFLWCAGALCGII